MTNQEAPHFTVEMILGTLRHLRGDLEAARTSVTPEGDERAKARMEAGRRMGLDRLAAEAVAAIDEAARRVEKGPWPGGLDIRYLGMVGALRALLQASEALQPGVNAADLSDLAAPIALVEQASGSAVRAARAQALRGLYVIVDPALTNGRDVAAVAEQALDGGATSLQLRVKDTDKGDWLPLARRIAALCDARGALLFINDHPDMAVASGAHGVHLGQHDMPLAAVRGVLRPWQLAGTSNALVDEAQASLDGGADYIAVGRMFPTGSKSNTRPAGPETLAKVRALVPADGPPVLAIGGITPENVGEVAKAGADGICVIAAVTSAPDPRAAAERLLTAFREAQ